MCMLLIALCLSLTCLFLVLLNIYETHWAAPMLNNVGELSLKEVKFAVWFCKVNIVLALWHLQCADLTVIYIIHTVIIIIAIDVLYTLPCIMWNLQIYVDIEWQPYLLRHHPLCLYLWWCKGEDRAIGQGRGLQVTLFPKNHCKQALAQ